MSIYVTDGLREATSQSHPAFDFALLTTHAQNARRVQYLRVEPFTHKDFTLRIARISSPRPGLIFYENGHSRWNLCPVVICDESLYVCPKFRID